MHGISPRRLGAFVLLAALTGAAAHAGETRNVVLVTFDGLRWQEVFGGADASLFAAESGGVEDPEALAERFGGATGPQRRERLLPFFWSVLARQGQVFGDPGEDAPVRVTNGRNFSYPGYNEILSGHPDDRIDSNDKRPNPNTTVLAWLQKREAFAGRVAAFGSWDVFPFILDEEHSGVYVNAGWEPLESISPPRRRREVEYFRRETPHYWGGVRFDVFTFEGALGFLEARKPRVLYVAFGETDDWAHDRRYDLYLDAARRTDDYLRRLWEAVQASPRYRGKTSLIVTTDHGRGGGAEDWTSHGSDVAGSDRIWIAVLGPDTPPLGLRHGVETTQSQVAASVAALLGLDLRADEPEVAPPLPGILGP